MKTVATIVLSIALVVTGASALAQDAAKKTDGTMKKGMTMQECKAYMATSKADGTKKEDMPKMDAMCADMLKKDEAMKKDAPPATPVTK